MSMVKPPSSSRPVFSGGRQREPAAPRQRERQGRRVPLSGRRLQSAKARRVLLNAHLLQVSSQHHLSACLPSRPKARNARWCRPREQRSGRTSFETPPASRPHSRPDGAATSRGRRGDAARKPRPSEGRAEADAPALLRQRRPGGVRMRTHVRASCSQPSQDAEKMRVLSTRQRWP